jgi:hypothetical protein
LNKKIQKIINKGMIVFIYIKGEFAL